MSVMGITQKTYKFEPIYILLSPHKLIDGTIYHSLRHHCKFKLRPILWHSEHLQHIGVTKVTPYYGLLVEPLYRLG